MRGRLFKVLSATVGFAVFAAADAGGSRVRMGPWPAVRALHAEHTFINPGAGGKDTPFFAFVRDTRGVSVYKFECHNGNYDGESEINFSGDFQCALFAVSGRELTSGNLLAADTKDELSTDWWNRGRMLANQLRGKCLSYTEYSTNRHFEVRGMLITMQFTKVGWSAKKNDRGNPTLTRFTFTLNVIPDSKAHGSRAELPPGPKPPTSCYP